MKTTVTLSSGELYQMFGYQQVPNYEQAFGTLLYTIAPRVFPDCPSLYQNIDGTTMMDMPYPALDKAQDELPKYLGKKAAFKKLLRIDAQMRAIQLAKRQLRIIRWWQFRKLYHAWFKLRRLASRPVDIQSVFGYLEYRAKKSGRSLKQLHMEFKEFAKTYQPTLLFGI